MKSYIIMIALMMTTGLTSIVVIADTSTQKYSLNNKEMNKSNDLHAERVSGLLTRGPECPVGSGEYCPDEFPICCAISKDGGPREWTCVAKLEDCKDK